MGEASRAALVTGGAARLGRAIVEDLAGSGWSVTFTFCRSADQAGELVDRLTAQGRDVAAIRVDLEDEAGRRELVAEVGRRVGGLDALVNNAAVFPRNPVETLRVDDLRAVMGINLEAPLFLTLACADMLRSRGGSVVNIADVHGVYPLRGHLPYSVSKAALIAATRALAVELAPHVRVNAVAPGIALFPPHYDADLRRRLLQRTLLGQEGGAAEIARAVRFLLADTHTTTGHVLTVDGGRTVTV